MANNYPTNTEVIQGCYFAVRARTGFEKKAGQCKRFVRQLLLHLEVPEDARLPAGLDAKETAEWIRRNRPQHVVRNGSVPGDILFYENGHGPHGHVVVRLPGNIGGENSTAHAPEGQEDGRGYRPLARIGNPTLIYRVWRAKP